MSQLSTSIGQNVGGTKILETRKHCCGFFMIWEHVDTPSKKSSLENEPFFSLGVGAENSNGNDFHGVSFKRSRTGPTAAWCFSERSDLVCCENSGLNLWKVGGDHELFDTRYHPKPWEPMFSCILIHIFGWLKTCIFPWVLLGSKGIFSVI